MWEISNSDPSEREQLYKECVYDVELDDDLKSKGAISLKIARMIMN